MVDENQGGDEEGQNRALFRVGTLGSQPIVLTHVIERIESADELARISEPQARGFLTHECAFELEVLPLQIIVKKNQRVLRVAINDKEDHERQKMIEFSSGLVVELIQVDQRVLHHAISIAYLGDSKLLVESVKDLEVYGESVADVVNKEFSNTPADNQVTRFVNRIIEYAFAHGASDIHFNAREKGLFVQLRIGGELRDHHDPLAKPEVLKQVVSRIKIMAGLDITERASSQDGRISYRIKNKKIEIRVNTLPTVYGENVVFRLFGLQEIPALSSLALPPALLELVELSIQRCAGALIIAGPTGSGKSTTLYAIAKELHHRRKSVSSIEDPVELIIDGISQTSINEQQSFGFPQALRSVLRQDPDAILIGEMREQVSASIAFEAALSGHCILSTVHGGSIVDALNRIEFLGLSRAQVSQSLDLLIVQRLFNRLCKSCRVFDLRAAQILGFDTYKPAGCTRCYYRGYEDRVLGCEYLAVDDNFKELYCREPIITQKSLARLCENNYVPIKHRVRELLEQGLICYAQAQPYLNS